MLKTASIICLATGLAATALGQTTTTTYTSTSPPIAIPDGNPAGVCMTITVPAGTGTVNDVDVRMTVDHPFAGDTSARLDGPGCAVATVFNRPGPPPIGSFGTFCAATPITFEDDAATIPASKMGTQESAPSACVGTVGPTNYISDSASGASGLPPALRTLGGCDGTPAAGDWVFCVADNIAPDSGTFRSWSLILTTTTSGVNQPPNAVNDAASTGINTAVTISVLANDSDADGDTLAITAFESPTPQGGTAVVDNNGTPANTGDDRIVYTPAPGFDGSDSFGYTISDGNGGSDTATVTVLVTAAACTEPGLTVLTDPAGDQTGTPANGIYDIRSISFAQPCFPDRSDKLVVTLQMGEAFTGAPPANSAWYAFFTYAGVQYFTGLTTISNPPDVAIPALVYGRTAVFPPVPATTTFLGPAEDTSAFLPDGRIRMVLSLNKLTQGPAVADPPIAPPPPGAVISNVRGLARVLAGGAGSGIFQDIDSTSVGTYTMAAAGLCGCAAPDRCTVPGTRLFSDFTGDSLDHVPGHELQWYSVAEPAAIGGNPLTASLVFTYKVQDLAAVPASTSWPFYFDTAAGRFYVDMATDPAGAVTFNYGTLGAAAGNTVRTLLGAADAGSGFLPDGTITIVIARSKIGNPGIGQTLTRIVSRLTAGTAATPDNGPNSTLANSGVTYTVAGNCIDNQAPDAVNDADSTLQNTAKIVNVLANDSDPDGDALTVRASPSPPTATWSTTATDVTYTPTTATRARLLHLHDQGRPGVGYRHRPTVTMTVSPEPTNAPVAVDDSASRRSRTPP